MGSSPSTLNRPSLTSTVSEEEQHSDLMKPPRIVDSDVLPSGSLDTHSTTDDDVTPPTWPTTFAAMKDLTLVSPRVVLSEHTAHSLPTPLGAKSLPPLALRTQSTTSGARYPLGADLPSLHLSTDDMMTQGTRRVSCSQTENNCPPSSPLNCSGKRGVSTLAALTHRNRGMGSSVTSLQSVNFMRTVSNPQPSGSASLHGVPSPKMFTSVISDRSPLTTQEDAVLHNHNTSGRHSSTMFGEGRSPPAYHHHLPALPASNNQPHHHRRPYSSSGSDNSHSDLISANGDDSDDEDCFKLLSRRGTPSETPSARSTSMGDGGASCLFSHISRAKDHRVGGASVRTSTTPSNSNGISRSYLGESSATTGLSNEVNVTTASLPQCIKAKFGESVGAGRPSLEDMGTYPPTASP